MGSGGGARGGTAESLVQVLDHLLQGYGNACLFVVCRDYHTDANFGGLNGADVWHGEAIWDGWVGLVQATFGEPAIVPAGEGSGVADGAIRVGGNIRLFGREGRPRLGRDEVKDDVCLQVDELGKSRWNGER